MGSGLTEGVDGTFRGMCNVTGRGGISLEAKTCLVTLGDIISAAGLENV